MRTRQASQQLHALRAVVVTKGRERVLQQRDEVRIARRPAPDPPAAVAHGCRCEPVGKCAAAGDRGGVQEGRPGWGELAGPVLGLSESEEQVAMPGVVPLLAERQRFDRHPVETGRFLVAVQPHRAVTRSSRISDRLLDIAARRGRIEMMRELPEVWLEVAGVQLLEDLPEPAVEPDAPGGRHRVVERVADQRVREAQAAQAAGHVRDDAGVGRLVEHVQQVVAGEFAPALERLEAELAPDHRREREDAAAVVGEPLQATLDHVTHTLGNRQPPQGLTHRGLETPFVHQQTHHLANEERIAFCLAVDSDDDVAWREDSRRQLNETSHIWFGEPAHVEAARHALAPELRDGRSERVTRADLDLPMRADKHDARLRELSSNELKQEQRRRVGGVEVVENDQERLRRPCRTEEGGRRIEKPKPRVLRIVRRRCQHVSQQLTYLGHDLRELRGARPELSTQVLWDLDADVRPQCLHPRPIGGRPTRFPAPAPQDTDALLLGSSGQLIRQPALADPGLASDEEEPAAPLHRVVEPGDQLAELALSPNKHIAGTAARDVTRTNLHGPIVPSCAPARTSGMLSGGCHGTSDQASSSSNATPRRPPKPSAVHQRPPRRDRGEEIVARQWRPLASGRIRDSAGQPSPTDEPSDDDLQAESPVARLRVTPRSHGSKPNSTRSRQPGFVTPVDVIGGPLAWHHSIPLNIGWGPPTLSGLAAGGG